MDLPNPEIKPRSPALQVDSSQLSYEGSPPFDHLMSTINCIICGLPSSLFGLVLWGPIPKFLSIMQVMTGIYQPSNLYPGAPSDHTGALQENKDCFCHDSPMLKRPRFDFWVGKIHWRRDRLPTPVLLGFPCGSAGKESTCKAGDLGSFSYMQK